MHKKVKILQVIHGMHFGGAENVVKHLSLESDHNLFESTICCTNFLGALGEQLIADGYAVELLPPSLGIFATLKNIMRLINDKKPDIIHTHGIPAFLAVAPLYLLRRRPYWMHTFHFGNYPHIKRSYLYAQRILSRFANQLIAVSNSQKQAIIDHLYVSESKITTVFNGVPENSFRQDAAIRGKMRLEFGYTDEDIVLVSICVLTKQKGISYLLDAVDEIVTAVPNAKILIVGGGDVEEELWEKSRGLKCSASVQFAGWRSDVYEILASADAFVLPSLWEGLPMVLLEAMSTGLPILVTDVSDNSGVIKDGESGYVVPPADAGLLAKAAIKLLSDKNKMRAFGAASLDRYSSFFSVGKMLAGYEAIYLDLVRTGSKRS